MSQHIKPVDIINYKSFLIHKQIIFENSNYYVPKLVLKSFGMSNLFLDFQ